MSTLPPIGSDKFKKLHYKEKLYILNLYYHDSSKYLELCGKPGKVSKELEYIDKSITDLFNDSAPPNFQTDIPLSFVENCWCAYLSNFNPAWWEVGFSPLDFLGLDHKRIFNIQLFNFPLLSFDSVASKIFRWLLKNPSKTRKGSDILYYVVRLRAAYNLFHKDQKIDEVEIWNSSITQLGDFLTVDEVNKASRVIDDNDLLEQLELDYYVLLTDQIKIFQKRHFIPLIPAQLYMKDKFSVKGWDFLVS